MLGCFGFDLVALRSDSLTQGPPSDFHHIVRLGIAHRATFQGVTPTRVTIASGKYRVSRPLFIYVKTQHYGTTPGLQEFVQYMVSDDLAGPDGTMVEAGLVADPKLADTQAKLK